MAGPLLPILGMVLTAATTAKQMEEQRKAQMDQANKKAMGEGGNMMMKPAFNDPEKVYGANAKTGMLPAQDPEEEMWRLAQGMASGTIASSGPAIRPNSVPDSRMQPEIEKANKRENVGVSASQGGNYPLTPQEAGKFGTGELLTPNSWDPPPQPPPDTKKMTFDEKMQYAALAAQLGSAIAGQGGPPPPSAPRGGGISMAPVFQNITARGMYGG